MLPLPHNSSSTVLLHWPEEIRRKSCGSRCSSHAGFAAALRFRSLRAPPPPWVRLVGHVSARRRERRDAPRRAVAHAACVPRVLRPSAPRTCPPPPAASPRHDETRTPQGRSAVGARSRGFIRFTRDGARARERDAAAVRAACRWRRVVVGNLARWPDEAPYLLRWQTGSASASRTARHDPCLGGAELCCVPPALRLRTSCCTCTIIGVVPAGSSVSWAVTSGFRSSSANKVGLAHGPFLGSSKLHEVMQSSKGRVLLLFLKKNTIGTNTNVHNTCAHPYLYEYVRTDILKLIKPPQLIYSWLIPCLPMKKIIIMCSLWYMNLGWLAAHKRKKWLVYN